MSEEHAAVAEEVAKIRHSICLGLRKEIELIEGFKSRLEKSADEFATKLSELTGLDPGAIAHMDLEHMSSADPITQLEINNLVTKHLSRYETENHRFENYRRAINRRADYLNGILLKLGQRTI